MPDNELVSTQTLFEHPKIRIIQDILKHNNREICHLYLESPVEAVATVGITNGREIILLWEYRHALGRETFGLPSGRLKVGETPIDGARREFEEETGYRPGHIESLGYYNQFPGFIRVATNLFFASDLEHTKQVLDKDENIRVVTKTVTEVLAMILEGLIVDGSLQLGVLLAIQQQLLDP